MLDVELPNLCGFFDDYVYPNEDVTKLLNNSAYFIDMPMQLFLQKLNMSPEQLDEFKSEILKYSKRNLIKITAYIEKVFAAQYITDQVNLIKVTRREKSIIISFLKYLLMQNSAIPSSRGRLPYIHPVVRRSSSSLILLP